HMNGRIYDVDTGRFMQTDPFVQAPSNLQNYNAYSYVLNNPLSYTDPSGYLFKKLFKAIADVPLLNIAVQAVMAFYCQVCLVAYNALSTYAVTGSLKAGVIAGLSSAAMPGGGSVGNVIGSAAIGGVAAKLQGGNFSKGFFAAGLGAATGGIGRGVKNPIGQILIGAAVGGTVSKLTGGKFANGAYSAAFSTAIVTAAGNSSNTTTSVQCNGGDCSTQVDTGQLADIDPELAALWADDLRSQGESNFDVLNALDKHSSKGISFSTFDIQLLGVRKNYQASQTELADQFYNLGVVGVTGYTGVGLVTGAAARLGFLSTTKKSAIFGLTGETLSLLNGIGKAPVIRDLAPVAVQNARAVKPFMPKVRATPSGKAYFKVKNGKYVLD
ncbi:RHS repeat-associated core domain-containing protein, partial [Pseudoalteromonas luteoviolacea]